MAMDQINQVVGGMRVEGKVMVLGKWRKKKPEGNLLVASWFGAGSVPIRREEDFLLTLLSLLPCAVRR
eukprot:3942789-Amphidinium_carterae.1